MHAQVLRKYDNVLWEWSLHLFNLMYLKKRYFSLLSKAHNFTTLPCEIE